MPKRKAPEPASELETTVQGTDAATNHSDSSSRDAQGERERDCGESTRTRGEAARNGEKAARIERAAEIAHDADEWVEEHPDVWRFATDLCLNEARAKRRVSMQYASEVIRKKDFASFKRYGSGINNRLRPALARRLVREHPEVAPFIELRKSALDLIGEVGADE